MKQKTEAVKEMMERTLGQFENMVNEMPFRGNTQEESQKVALQNAVNNLFACINGLQDEDFDH